MHSILSPPIGGSKGEGTKLFKFEGGHWKMEAGFLKFDSGSWNYYCFLTSIFYLQDLISTFYHLSSNKIASPPGCGKTARPVGENNF